MSESAIDGLLQIMQRLRDPDSGCPWDIEQTLQSLTPFTIEEAYEVEEAAHGSDPEALKDELGDLLFQVVFYARIAEEQGLFAFDDVVAAIGDKLVRRHPHVFADARIESVEEQSRLWDELKKQERDQKQVAESALEGVGTTLPALMRAQKLQRRAARVGFDWTEAEPVLGKVSEEVNECRQALQENDCQALHDEVGDLLFSCVNFARHVDVDADHALRDANRKFERRFRAVEQLAMQQGKTAADLSMDELERLWLQVKSAE